MRTLTRQAAALALLTSACGGAATDDASTEPLDAAMSPPAPDAAPEPDAEPEPDAAPTPEPDAAPAPEPATDCKGEAFPTECPPDAPIVPLDDTPLSVPVTWSYSPRCNASIGPQVWVVVPPGATRFGFTVDAGEADTGFEVAVDGVPLLDPDGKDTARALGVQRASAATARFPAGDTFAPPAGCVAVRPRTFTAATVGLPARVVFRASDAPVDGGALTLALGALDGVDIGPDDLAALQQGVHAVYATAGIEVRFTTIDPVPWADGPDVSLFGERSDLLQQSQVEGATTILLVSHLIGTAGDFTTIGIAGGIPGPVVGDAGAPGLLVAIEPARAPDAHLDVATLVQTTAHELGHHLGLFHTSERDETTHDALADTPECLPDQDPNGDGRHTVSECPDATNFMFWLAGPQDSAMPFSPRQIELLRSSLFVRPD